MDVIGIDLGATKVAGARFARNGEILARRTAPLEKRQGAEVGELITRLLGELLATGRPEETQAVGVCVPGIAWSDRGRVWAPNIPGWEDYPLRDEIQSLPAASDIRIGIDSDRACSLLGEIWRGTAQGCANAVFLAVGTGIGAGIMVDGRILRGADDIAGAIGWMALDRPFRPEYVECGCFEHHASGAGIAKVARELLAIRRDYSGVLRDTPAGQITARDVFGGGIFGPAREFLQSIAGEARKWAQPISITRVRFEASRLGGDAALYGAGHLALRIMEDHP